MTASTLCSLSYRVNSDPIRSLAMNWRCSWTVIVPTNMSCCWTKALTSLSFHLLTLCPSSITVP